MDDLTTTMRVQEQQRIPNDVPALPSPEVPSQMSFIFNNLSYANLANHAQFVKDTMSTAEHWKWLAHYLVMKRTPAEPNYHGLYAQFMDLINVSYFTDAVLTETYFFVRSLLRSPSMAQSNADRTCLKNLGKWLGTITLARNKPILTIEIDMKNLIIEAYAKGDFYLRFVLPFVARVLETSVNSKIFRPPNPWLIGILSILLEVHSNPKLELNLKFEVEVLFKNLKIDEKSVKPANCLQNLEECKKVYKDNEQLSPFLNHGPMAAAPGTAPTGLAASIMKDELAFPTSSRPPHVETTSSVTSSAPMVNNITSSSAGAVTSSTISSNDSMYTSVNDSSYTPRFTIVDVKSWFDSNVLNNLLQVKPSIPAVIMCPQLKQFVATGVDRTINEILPGLLERASKIALSTTESLVRKDFCMCSNEAVIRAAAHNMIGNLVSGLVLIGGREQLFRQMVLNLQQICSQVLQHRRLYNSTTAAPGAPAGQYSANHIDEICKDAALSIARDNIELCVCIMARIAMHRSMQELERRLQPMFEALRRNALSQEPCLAVSINNERLPEAIRLKWDDMSDNMLANYHQFARTVAGFKSLPNDVTPDLVNLEFLNFLERMRLEVDAIISYKASLESQVGDSLDDTQVNSKLRNFIDFISQLKKKHGLLNGTFGIDVSESTNLLVARTCYLFMDLYDEETLCRLSPEFTNRFRDFFFTLFRHLTDTNVLGPAWAMKSVIRAIVTCREPCRGNLLTLPLFIKLKLLTLSMLDVELHAELRNADEHVDESTLLFALNLIRYCLLECANTSSNAITHASSNTSGPNMTYNLHELQHTIDVLQRRSILNPMIDEYAWNVLEVVRINYELNVPHAELRPPAGYRPLMGLPVLYSAVAQVRSDAIRSTANPSEFADLQDKTIHLFQNWISVHRAIPGTDLHQKEAHHTFAGFVLQMSENGIFKADDLISGFFRICIQACVTRTYELLLATHQVSVVDDGQSNKENESGPGDCGGLLRDDGRFQQPALACQLSAISPHHECYELCDAFIKLVVLLIKHSGESRNVAVKISLLNKVLGLIAGCCMLDSDLRGCSFYPLPYQRMFLSLFRELLAAEFFNDSTHYLFSQSIMSAYFLLNPTIVPSFAFSWMELIGYGPFIGKVLQTTGQVKNTQCWTTYASLLSSLLRFLGPFVTGAVPSINNDWVAFMFKGTLRIFLTLLHDFPEFLVEYAYEIIDYLPVRCIQLRNIILSAFSRQMKLPDPINQALKVDLLAEININPPMNYNYASRIQPLHFKHGVDNYLGTRTPPGFLSSLRSNLVNQNGYNVKVMNALVFYVGIRAIETMIRRGHRISPENIINSAHMDIFDSLLVDLDCEGRYLFLNAMTNHIRYPNCHTHYFSCCLLHLFASVDSMMVKEQIVRVLIERLVVNRPHPWGLLVTFVELVRNKQYRLMECPFVHRVPEIQRIFECANHPSSGAPVIRRNN